MDDPVDPLRIDGRRIIEGRPSPRVDFFLSNVRPASFSGLVAVIAPASKVLPK
jgi:hypothetical protein